MASTLKIGPDVYHRNGHFDWTATLRNPQIHFAWCKGSQYVVDTECAYNLNAFQTGVKAGDIDWYGAYHWPTMHSVVSQVALYLEAIGKHADDPLFRWVIDCEGGSVEILDALAEQLTAKLGAERGGIYGGSYLINEMHDPTPEQAPHAAALKTFFRAAYINDPPGTGRNTIPRLYAHKGPTYWQYTNGISGPNDREQFPRSLTARGPGDYSCFWQDTAGATYEEWLKATTPGGNDEDMDQATFNKMHNDAHGTPSVVYWQRFTIGLGDATIAGREHQPGIGAAYEDGYKLGQQILAGGGNKLPVGTKFAAEVTG